MTGSLLELPEQNVQKNWVLKSGTTRGGILLVPLSQVVPLNVVPQPLGHFRGRNLLALLASQNGGQGGVQLDPVSSEGSFLTWRHIHLPGPECTTYQPENRSGCSEIHIVTKNTLTVLHEMVCTNRNRADRLCCSNNPIRETVLDREILFFAKSFFIENSFFG